VKDTFVREWRRDGYSAITSIDARAGGPVYEYWGNTISVSVGTEYRFEDYMDHRPPYVGTNPPGSGLDPDGNDYILASPKPNSEGDRTVFSAYAEAVVPVVSRNKDITLVDSLELTASARYEKYSDFGTTTNPKLGLNWRPIRQLMVRASYNEGFAAANLPTLYAPSQYTVDSTPGQTDIYRNVSAVSSPTYVQRNYSEGNKALMPVESKGKSAGIVLDVPWVKGLTVTADYWEIEQTNEIGSRTASQILANDNALLQAYIASQLASGKTIAQIDLGSGTANYKGDPAVVRYPVSSTDTADYAGKAPVAGLILSRSGRYENLAKGLSSGVDIIVNYNLPELPVGRISLNTDWTYMIESNQLRIPAGGVPTYVERMNSILTGVTRWRGTTTINWRKSNWNGNLGVYYVGSMADTGATTTQVIYDNLGQPGYISKQFDGSGHVYRYRIRDVVSMNASIGYRFTDESSKWLNRTSVRLGVNNLTDKLPPLTSGSQGFSSSTHNYLFAGRTWTLDVTRQF
jgi:iron complex outermembrane recepter protein